VTWSNIFGYFCLWCFELLSEGKKMAIFWQKLIDTGFRQKFFVVFLKSHRQQTPKNATKPKKNAGKLASGIKFLVCFLAPLVCVPPPPPPPPPPLPVLHTHWRSALKASRQAPANADPRGNSR
jgi:hypothetical protein